jgi:hypothetical protein
MGRQKRLHQVVAGKCVVKVFKDYDAPNEYVIKPYLDGKPVSSDPRDPSFGYGYEYDMPSAKDTANAQLRWLTREYDCGVPALDGLAGFRNARRAIIAQRSKRKLAQRKRR